MMNRKFKGLWFPAEILLSKELTLQEKFLVVDIDSFERCFKTNKAFSDEINVTPRRVQQILQGMKEKGIIEISVKRDDKGKVIERILKVTNSFKRKMFESTLTPPEENFTPPPEENFTTLTKFSSRKRVTVESNNIRKTEEEEARQREDSQTALKAYRTKIYPDMNSRQESNIISFVNDFGLDWVLRAIDAAQGRVQRKGSADSYIGRILVDWNEKGVSDPWNHLDFKPPTKEEVMTYCNAEQCHIDVDAFMDYYAANGWRTSRGPLKDWKAAVRNWKRRDDQRARQPQKETLQERQKRERAERRAFLEALARGDEERERQEKERNKHILPEPEFDYKF